MLSTTAQTADPASVTFTATTVGTYILRLQTNNPPGPCPFVTDDVTITVAAPPTAAAGNDAAICAGDTHTLSGASIGGAASTGTWSIISPATGGTLSSTAPTATPQNVTFTATAAGSYRLLLTTNDPAGVCTAASDEVVITVNAAPIANAGADRNLCSPVNIRLTGSSVSGSATTGAWSIEPPFLGDGALTTTAQTATPQDVFFSATQAGTYTLRLTTNSPSGICPVDTDEITITVNPAPTVNAGSDNTICAGVPYTLSGATVGGAATTGAWAITSPAGGGGAILSTTAQTNNPSNVTFTATTTGNYTLRLTTNNPVGPCNAVNDLVILTVVAAP